MLSPTILPVFLLIDDHQENLDISDYKKEGEVSFKKVKVSRTVKLRRTVHNLWSG